MIISDIEKAVQLANAIDTFKRCYDDCILWGSAPDGDVKPDKMIEWLTEHEHMIEIAKLIIDNNK